MENSNKQCTWIILIYILYLKKNTVTRVALVYILAILLCHLVADRLIRRINFFFGIVCFFSSVHTLRYCSSDRLSDWVTSQLVSSYLRRNARVYSNSFKLNRCVYCTFVLVFVYINIRIRRHRLLGFIDKSIECYS